MGSHLEIGVEKHLHKTRKWLIVSTMLRSRAFILIELLVVIAIVSIMTCILLPAVSKAKMSAQRTVCLNNLQQLNLGCKMYSDDNGGQLVASWPLGPVFGEANPYCWCPGWASTAPQMPVYGIGPDYSCTNDNALKLGKIWPYIDSVEVYRCPSDNREVDGQPVVRSFSMNSWINGRSQGDPTGYSTSATPGNDQTLSFTLFRREGQVLHPEQIWRLIEEDGSSINDGMFVLDMGRVNRTTDLPSTRHGAAYGLTFMDGHSENVTFRAPASDWNQQSPNGGDPDWVYLQTLTTFSNKNNSVDGLRLRIN
jgi:type II secretory pathway pseudopilin PulG